jgi:hypothetical protein
VPAATVEPTAIVKVELPVPVIDMELKVKMTPLAWAEIESDAAELNPPVAAIVNVVLPELPAAIDSDAGDAPNVKPNAGFTVRVIVVDSKMLPEVPVTVMV